MDKVGVGALRCPFCGHEDSKVLDSRRTEDGHVIRRRRECLDCSERFTTYEKLEATPFRVIKKDGRREPFNPEKIREGVLTACEKRPVSVDQIEALVRDIERELRSRFEREVETEAIGARVMERLRELDEVAYVRFASVYRQFKDLESFRIELERLLNGGDE